MNNEALRLADTLEHEYKFVVVERSDKNGDRIIVDANIDSAILELRRLHEVNAELVEALKAMCSYTAELNPNQGFDGFDHLAVNKARAAIAKAGESE